MTGHVLSVAAGVTGRASPIAPVPVEEGFNTDQELAPTHRKTFKSIFSVHTLHLILHNKLLGERTMLAFK